MSEHQYERVRECVEEFLQDTNSKPLLLFHTSDGLVIVEGNITEIRIGSEIFTLPTGNNPVVFPRNQAIREYLEIVLHDPSSPPVLFFHTRVGVEIWEGHITSIQGAPLLPIVSLEDDGYTSLEDIDLEVDIPEEMDLDHLIDEVINSVYKLHRKE